MPGIATTTFLPAAAAGFAVRVMASTMGSAAPASSFVIVLRIVSSLKAFTSFLAMFQNELGLARFAHQRAPHTLAQLAKARFAQRVAGARARQVDSDGLVDARRPAFEHDDAMAEQHGFLDRMGDEDHRGRSLIPDAQQLELQNLARLRVDRGERLLH